MLLVEDDNEVAALVTEMLRELGWSVTRAASAEAALGALANNRDIALVFSDIMMPGGMNGVELAREIRRRRPSLPIVLTSGYSEAAANDARAEGIDLLPKPYRLEELDAALSAAA
jgi:CheY-like chemotaxis protein